MIGTGGDQAARQDMFPTRSPTGRPRTGSAHRRSARLIVRRTTNPIEVELKGLNRLREENPALSTGWTIVRVAKAGILAVSRVDPVTRHEYVAIFNNGASGAQVKVPTSTPSTTWQPLWGRAATMPFSSNAAGVLAYPVSPGESILARGDAVIPAQAPSKPKLVVKADDLSSLWADGDREGHRTGEHCVRRSPARLGRLAQARRRHLAPLPRLPRPCEVQEERADRARRDRARARRAHGLLGRRAIPGAHALDDMSRQVVDG